MKNGLYSGLDAEFYDELLEGELEDLPFWKRLLESNPGTALEVGCGTGRIMLPLIQDGHQIEGMDSSKRMVDILLQKAQQLNLAVNARVQVMEDLDMGKSYDMIFIPGFSLQMVESHERLKQSLRRFYKHMNPGGKLAVSLFFPWEELEEDERG